MTGLLTVFRPRDPNSSFGPRCSESMVGPGERFLVTVELLIQEPCGAPVTLDAAVWRVQSRIDATLLDHETPVGHRLIQVHATTLVVAIGREDAERQVDIRLAALAARNPRRVIGGEILAIEPVAGPSPHPVPVNSPPAAA